MSENKYKFPDFYGDFNTVMYRYAVMVDLLGYSPKITSKNHFFTEEEKKRILNETQYSEQGERAILFYADEFISKPAFEWIFDASADDIDITDILICAEEMFSDLKSAEETITKNDEKEETILKIQDYSRVEKAIIIALFIRAGRVFSDVDFETAFEIAGSDDIIINCEERTLTYSEKLQSAVKKLNEPVAWFDDANYREMDDEYDERIEKTGKQPPTYIINTSRLPFILKWSNRLYGIDFIKYASVSALILCKDEQEIEDRYKKYLHEYKLKFKVGVYSRIRYYCGKNEYNFVDYCRNDISDGYLKSSVLIPDRELDISLSEKKISQEVGNETTEKELLSKVRSECSEKNVMKNETVIDIKHEGRDYWYVYIDKSYEELSADGFTIPAFDYAELFGIVKKEADRGNLRRINGNIEFSVDPSEFADNKKRLTYAKNVLADYFARKEKQGRIVKGIKERVANAVTYSKEKAAKEKAEKDIKKSGGGNNSSEGCNIE